MKRSREKLPHVQMLNVEECLQELDCKRSEVLFQRELQLLSKFSFYHLLLRLIILTFNIMVY